MRGSVRSTAETRTSGSRRPRVPRTRRGWLLAALAAVLLGIAAFVAVYFTLFSGSSAAPLTLSSGSASGRALSAATAAGVWSIAPHSVVGYRVREKLAFLPAKSDAVGRTSDVAGSLSAVRSGSGLTLTVARFMADVRTLKSDRSMRDAQMHRIGLQSNQYPTAGFTLTRPISVPAAALRGQVFHTTATGLLTIHGTTRTVTIPMTGQLKGSQVETVGSITFPFSEFGMQAPNIAGFVSVESHATMEFDLRFQRGSSARNAAALQAIAAARPGSSSSGAASGPGGPGGPRPNSKQFQAFAACMSQHGAILPAGPSAGAPPGPGSSPGASPRNPKMAAALKACSSLRPRFGPGPGGPPPGSAGQTR